MEVRASRRKFVILTLINYAAFIIGIILFLIFRNTFSRIIAGVALVVGFICADRKNQMFKCPKCKTYLFSASSRREIRRAEVPDFCPHCNAPIDFEWDE